MIRGLGFLAIALLSSACSDYSLRDLLFGHGGGEGIAVVPSDSLGVDSDLEEVDDTGCADRDADGHADAACGGDDCDDDDATVHPGAEELCDLQDNDCDGAMGEDEVDQDGDGSAVCDGDCDDTSVWFNGLDVDGDGVSSCEGDCEDDHPGLYPKDTSSPMVFVQSGADADAADGSRDAPYDQIQSAVDDTSGATIVCVGPGTYAPVNITGRSGMELIGPGDESALIDGSLTVGTSPDGQFAGLAMASFATSNDGGSSGRALIRHNLIDCTGSKALFLGRGDRESVISHNTLRGCAYGIYLNGSQANENHRVSENRLSDHTWNAVHFNWAHNVLVMNNRIEDSGAAGVGALGVDANARSGLLLGNTVLRSTDHGFSMDGPGTTAMWVWANLAVQGEGPAVVAGAGHVVGYNNFKGNGGPSQVGGTVESNFDSEVSLPATGFVNTRNPTTTLPSSWVRTLDVDLDGDDDAGDTLCAVGAWGEGNPLFGATAVRAEDDGGAATVSWTACDGDGDEVHAQAAFQVQTASKAWVYEPAVEHDSTELSSTDTTYELPGGLGKSYVRVRVQDEQGAWSAWSDGVDVYSP